MNQDDIKLEEWKDPQNWSLLFYHSERGSRKLVPKRFGIGWTYNFGTKKAICLFGALMAFESAGKPL